MVISMSTRNVSYVLAAFCIIPLGGTLYRLAEVIRTDQWLLDFNPAVVDNLPLFIHGIGMIIFLVLGALQLSVTSAFRRIRLHRVLGRLAGSGAVIGGLSGVWMTLAHIEISTPLLFGGRLLFGTAMAAFAVFAVRAAIHRNFVSHRNWIIRSYAIAFNAASLPLLSLLLLPLILIIAEPAPIVDDAIQVIGWILNLVIAEKFFVRRAFNKGVGI